MVDAKAFQEGVGRLLAEVQRIKAEGDYAAAKAAVRDLRRPLRPGAARRGRRARRPPAACRPTPASCSRGSKPVVDADGDDHRRQDLVSAGPDDADAGVFRPEEVTSRARSPDAAAVVVLAASAPWVAASAGQRRPRDCARRFPRRSIMAAEDRRLSCRAALHTPAIDAFRRTLDADAACWSTLARLTGPPASRPPRSARSGRYETRELTATICAVPDDRADARRRAWRSRSRCAVEPLALDTDGRAGAARARGPHRGRRRRRSTGRTVSGSRNRRDQPGDRPPAIRACRPGRGRRRLPPARHAASGRRQLVRPLVYAGDHSRYRIAGAPECASCRRSRRGAPGVDASRGRPIRRVPRRCPRQRHGASSWRVAASTTKRCARRSHPTTTS